LYTYELFTVGSLFVPLWLQVYTIRDLTARMFAFGSAFKRAANGTVRFDMFAGKPLASQVKWNVYSRLWDDGTSVPSQPLGWLAQRLGMQETAICLTIGPWSAVGAVGPLQGCMTSWSAARPYPGGLPQAATQRGPVSLGPHGEREG